MADNFGPGGVYANIPRVDSHGRVQIPMFLRWNPDPVGNEAKNLSSVDPALQKVIARARADNPGLSFVIGSGARSAQDQDLAKSWGWSRVGSKDGGDALKGQALDLWPLDSQGRVQFNSGQQQQIAAAVKKAAQAEGVNLNWGGDWKSFKDAQHFELKGGGSAAASGAPEGPTGAAAPATQPSTSRSTPSGTTLNSVPTTVTASTPFALSRPASSIPSAGQFQPLIDAAAAKYNLDPNFLARVLWQENRFRSEGTSPAGAQGIAQFMPATAARYGVNVHDPGSSIEGAAHYLSDLSGRYSGNLGLAAAGYNWGEGNVDKWLQGKGAPPSETTNYVSTITGHSMNEWRADPRLPLGSGGPGRSPSGPSGGSGTPAGGPAVAAAPGQPSGGSAGSLPGFQPGSPAEKMTSAGLKAFGLGGDKGAAAEPPPMPSAPAPMAQAAGGPMMLGPGGQNVPGRSLATAQNTLAQLAAYGVQAGRPVVLPGMATGIPGLPGTTLNSPSQLQMALMTGQMSPYDNYANAGYGGGSGSV